MTVETVIFNSFYTVIEVNRHRSVPVGILSTSNNIMSLSVVKTSREL